MGLEEDPIVVMKGFGFSGSLCIDQILPQDLKLCPLDIKEWPIMHDYVVAKANGPSRRPYPH